MGMAKTKHNASPLWIALFFAGFAIASCGGRIDPSSTSNSANGDDSAGDDTSSSGGDASSGVIGFEAGVYDASLFDDDGGPAPYPPVDDGPNDTDPACESREPFSCSCTGEDCPDPPDWYFGQVVENCLGDGASVCGWVYADFDDEGCAVDLRAYEANDAFVACVTKKMNSERWLCMSGMANSQLSTYVDCTTK